MNLVITFTNKDQDVSSGTRHALHQWNEVLEAFSIEKVIIVNESDLRIFTPLTAPNSCTIVSNMDQALSLINKDSVGFVEQGDGVSAYELEEWPQWLIFGSVNDLEKSDITLPISNALYAREAAVMALTIWKGKVCPSL